MEERILHFLPYTCLDSSLGRGGHSSEGLRGWWTLPSVVHGYFQYRCAVFSVVNTIMIVSRWEGV